MDNFITYEYEWLKELTAELPTNHEKIGALRFEQKKINQLILLKSYLQIKQVKKLCLILYYASFLFTATVLY